MLWATDPDGSCSYISRGWYEFTGQVDPEGLGFGWIEAVHPDDREATRAAFLAASERREPFSVDYRIRCRHDGSYCWAIDAGRPRLGPDGEFLGMVGSVIDITPRKQAEQALREGEERFRTLADNIAQLAWMADDSGAISWYNKRWFDYTGTTFEAMKGWGWQAVHHPDHLDRVVARFRSCVEAGIPWEDTFPLRGANGEYCWFLSRAFPIHDAEGRVRLWFGTNTDITEQREAEQALRDADRRKNEFLAMLAHELRNPLAATRAGLAELRAPAAEPDALMAMLDRQTAHLARMIDDLLEVARVRQGKVRLRTGPTRLADVVASAAAAVAEQLREHRQELAVDLPDDLPPLQADPMRLEQVVVNLLNNAAKYSSPGGRIDLSARVEGKAVALSVRDRGVGMAPEVLRRAFDLFEQGDRSAARTEGGLGIGLTMARMLVEQHGGRLSASSPGPGLGSTFVVHLPFTDTPASALPANPPAPAADADADADTPAQSRRILLIDDNLDLARATSRLLSLRGHKIRTAPDGPSGLELARSDFDPEIILLDLGLPGMDGFRVAELLRADPPRLPLTIIAVSGYGSARDRERTRLAGFNHHLTKPVEFADLLPLIADAP